MKEIDWSKAPEGATHYFPLTGEWYKAGDAGLARAWTGSWVLAIMYESRFKQMIKRPQPWNGKGLPPVGTVCTAKWCGSEQGEVTVLFIGEEYAVLKNKAFKQEQCGLINEYVFSPIRTPEQIAADEREAAISELKREYSPARVHEWMAGQIYDTITLLGYRKP
jgi:hypothetical protein